MTALSTAPSRSRGPAADSGQARRALAVQCEVIDALPEAELRRLLKLVGGADPAALQRAAVTYTETFCALPQTAASVAALRPLALATQRCGQSR
jgi:hypothetical protein